jgi:uncharacterized protein
MFTSTGCRSAGSASGKPAHKSMIENLLLFVAGLSGGVISAAAGGASFVTFPALMFVGLSPLTANATNFVGLALAQPTALATSYREELRVVGSGLVPSSISAAIGGLCGALLLLSTGEHGFAHAVPWLMLLATVMFAGGPLIRRLIERVHGTMDAQGIVCQSFVFLLSIYCGYFGAGVGMMMLGVLAVFGYDDLHQANAVKNVVIMVSSLVATAVYGLSGPVAWPLALILMAGATLGAYAGGIIAKRAPQHLLRCALIALAAAFTGYLFLR